MRRKVNPYDDLGGRSAPLGFEVPTFGAEGDEAGGGPPEEIEMSTVYHAPPGPSRSPPHASPPTTKAVRGSISPNLPRPVSRSSPNAGRSVSSGRYVDANDDGGRGVLEEEDSLAVSSMTESLASRRAASGDGRRCYSLSPPVEDGDAPTEIVVAIRVRPPLEDLPALPPATAFTTQATSATSDPFAQPWSSPTANTNPSRERCLRVYAREGVLECLGYMPSARPGANGNGSSGTPGQKMNFAFDTVFDDTTTQEEINHVVGDRAVDRVLAGYHGTVLCYGQSGCGKTHTMVGPRGGDLAKDAIRHAERGDGPLGDDDNWSFSEDVGLVPRMLFRLFRRLQQQQESDGTLFSATISAIELYNEELRDLIPNDLNKADGPGGAKSARGGSSAAEDDVSFFADDTSEADARGLGGGGRKSAPAKDRARKVPGNRFAPPPAATTPTELKIVGNDGGGGANTTVRIDGLRRHSVRTYAEVIRALRQSLRERKMGATSLNINSSRSHTLIFVTVEQRLMAPASVRRSILTMVDLAGSERVGHTGAVGQRLKEAQKINLSLSQLGNVIRRLTSAKGGSDSHIPYRDSKLTRMLQDSFGGNTITFLLCNVSPDARDALETASTLRFAKLAKLVKNTATINATSSATNGNNAALVEQLGQARSYIHWLERQLDLFANRGNTEEDELTPSEPRLSGRVRGLEEQLEDGEDRIRRLEERAAWAVYRDGSRAPPQGPRSTAPPPRASMPAPSWNAAGPRTSASSVVSGGHRTSFAQSLGSHGPALYRSVDVPHAATPTMEHLISSYGTQDRSLSHRNTSARSFSVPGDSFHGGNSEDDDDDEPPPRFSWPADGATLLRNSQSSPSSADGSGWRLGGLLNGLRMAASMVKQ